MRHTVRHTLEKITRRLQLITPLVYRRSSPLEPFLYRELDGPLEPSRLDTDAGWERLEFGTH